MESSRKAFKIASCVHFQGVLYCPCGLENRLGNDTEDEKPLKGIHG